MIAGLKFSNLHLMKAHGFLNNVLWRDETKEMLSYNPQHHFCVWTLYLVFHALLLHIGLVFS